MSRRLIQCMLLLLFVWCIGSCKRRSSDSVSEQFLRLMNAGKNYLDQGDATNALAVYRKAQALVPHDADVHLNLANASLKAGAAMEAIRYADEVLQLDPNSAAAWFVKGSAHLRLSTPEEAVKSLENAKKIDPGETATHFQLGLARMRLQQWDAAIASFQDGLRLDPNRLHATAHYLLAQSLVRAGRESEAQQEMLLHQAGAGAGEPALGAATFERCKYTQARVPFRLKQPDGDGIEVRFVDATTEVFGEAAQSFSGPIAIVDANRTGWNSLFVLERRENSLNRDARIEAEQRDRAATASPFSPQRGEGPGMRGDPDRGLRSGDTFRLLWNSNGTFHPYGTSYPTATNATYFKMLVGDLDNDRFDDVIVLGDKGSHLFKFATNGMATNVFSRTGLSELNGTDGMLIDLDFTGKLDLVAVAGTNSEVRVLRQFGPLLFNEITRTSGVPVMPQNARTVMMEDWNRDGNMDVIVSRREGPPLLLEKQRGGPLVPRAPTNWVAGPVTIAADFDNDLRPDLAVWSEGRITLCFNNGALREFAAAGNDGVHRLAAFDYDNDGWLDLWAFGESIHVWRNAGLAGFNDETAHLGFDKFSSGAVAEIHFADFDNDCDSDVVVALANGGLRYLRNEGGNANGQVKVQMFGNRSNASGIGCKVEIETGGLRLIRTVHHLPVEVGVGKHASLDSFLVHWFNWPQGSAEVPVNCREPLFALELTIQEGSCPYLYAWDGQRFRFITDILGAAPLGLPVAEGRYIDADPEELVWIGNEQTFVPRDGAYELRITEELREVLYLDEAKLVIVDREPGTEVHSTDKLLPGKPFPPGELLTVHRERSLRRAETLDGEDVTAALRAVDGRRVSPPKLRAPQLRGLAEPHGLVLDFGVLETEKPLVLVMNGWLRFGGGMANIAASHDPSLPFPFPTLEAEVAPGIWKALEIVAGAPAGKTKAIVVDLEGKLAPGTRRLRLKQAFEIHWDRIALLERKSVPRTRVTYVPPSEANLHFRGFSALEDLPPDWPLTPDYNRVSPNSYWTITPGGWCTRYGDVLELIAVRDEGLALLNSGDELTLKFAADSLPPKPHGMQREFFLYVDGWDKDSDFHVAAGTEVEPLPFHGMNDQLYGREQRPAFASDVLHQKYNTRWVEGRVLKQTAKE